MGTLTLVRHGQARPFEKESDQLSATGEQQARRLGEFWLKHGVAFDEVYCGTLTRQRRTAELAGATFSAAGISWPELTITPELNEYDADGLLHRLAPALAARDAEFAKLVAAFEQNRTQPDRNRYFQKMFEAVTANWLAGELVIDGVESWADFRTRVREVMTRIINNESGGRRVAVFTSGGVIGLAVQTALGAPEQQALAINWRVRNCSLTEFIFSRGRLSLDSFNALPHLDEQALWTFR